VRVLAVYQRDDRFIGDAVVGRSRWPPICSYAVSWTIRRREEHRDQGRRAMAGRLDRLRADRQ